ncbi:hypothetical protein [Candidatus Contubernalis alkaliaceticus]|uniref:hypothetical protein n=1 Tax=Candidatus Contubernalis alkaliaceticus TaxID=338645 RepID=UPI001F4BD2BC|nr:hypothetical protein [Candidatus Contubernalis alkalaceticus]UNC93487.1 hypothetical protein HUE98_16230 [Candidatus Contubernalis alkalaceticus]
MSLTETNLLSIVKKQYRYKTKANAGVFFNLIAAQMLAFLFSLNGVASSGGGSMEGMSYTIKHISGDIIIIFTLIWAFMVGINMANNGFKIDFSFISNRQSSHLSSIAFLLTAAVVGGLTATLCGVLLRVVMFFAHSGVDTVSGFWIAPLTMLSSIFAAILYTLLFSCLGYFVSMLVQRNKAFALLLPGLFFGTLMVETRSTGQAQLLTNTLEFFTKESSPALFVLKIILVSAVLLGSVILFSDRMEVRK